MYYYHTTFERFWKTSCDSVCPSVPMLVLAGLFTLSTCCFVIFFHTRYRRMEAEEAAIYGTN